MVLNILISSARAVAARGLVAAGSRRCLTQVPRQQGLAALRPSFGCNVQGRYFADHVVKTPGFGAESITEGTVQEWKVKVGDTVKTGDLICMIETDKVTVEVNADADGTVTAIHIPVDENAEVGVPLCTLGEGGAAAAAPAAEAGGAAPAAAAAPTGETLTMKTPDFGAESITEGTVQEWRYKVGDFVKKGEIICLIETDKVTVEAAAEDSGTLTEILVDVEGTALKGEPLCTIALGGAPPAGGAAPKAAAPTAPAGPAAQKNEEVAPAVAAVDGKPERRVKMTRMRKAIAKNLKNAQDSTAMLSTFQEVDMSGIMALRKEYKESFEAAHGAKLGIMSAFIKASSFALEQIPAINAYIDEKTNEIVYRDYVDISVAAASPKGLVVPVLRNCESMTVAQTEEAMGTLAKKARADELTLDDMSGGTFTISNGGVFGSMLGTPIINYAPQSAILGMHATKMRPVVLKSGEIVARPIMYLALTYDHRLVDGREAVTFLCMVRDQVEDPRRLLLGV